MNIDLILGGLLAAVISLTKFNIEVFLIVKRYEIKIPPAKLTVIILFDINYNL